jgi:hypothetical protein
MSAGSGGAAGSSDPSAPVPATEPGSSPKPAAE